MCNELGRDSIYLKINFEIKSLYLSCPWDDKAIRRLIGDGKIAPRLVGSDEREHSSYRECPICFLHYSQINMTGCCKAYICSECYLQIKPQKDNNNCENSCCPFCTSPKLVVSVAQELNETEKKKIEEEQEEQIRLMKKASTVSNTSDKEENGFGKSLERHTSRLRSDSTVSSTSEDENTSKMMSAEERQLLEEEMKQQHLHPLTRQIEIEAEERRQEHDNLHRRRNINNINARLSRFRDGSALHRSLITHGASRSRMGTGRRREVNIFHYFTHYTNALHYIERLESSCRSI